MRLQIVEWTETCLIAGCPLQLPWIE